MVLPKKYLFSAKGARFIFSLGQRPRKIGFAKTSAEGANQLRRSLNPRDQE
jgi:hypothetical protein